MDEREVADELEEQPAAELSLESIQSKGGTSMQALLREVAKYPLLTKEEESKLFRRMAEGDSSAREKLINCNMRLAIGLARQQHAQLGGLPTGCSLEDLVSAAFVGLTAAVDKYDVGSDLRLSTYATYWINHEIKKHLADYSRAIKIPEHKVNLMIAVKKAESALADALRREPDASEVHRHLNGAVDIGKVEEALRLLRAGAPISLDSTVGDDGEDGRTVGESVEDPNAESPAEYADRVSRGQTIRSAVSSLPEKERIVIEMLFGFDGDEGKCTLEDVADALYAKGYANGDGGKMTKVAVHYIKQSALSKLASALQGLA